MTEIRLSGARFMSVRNCHETADLSGPRRALLRVLQGKGSNLARHEAIQADE
jgi:hypothetical protein